MHSLSWPRILIAVVVGASTSAMIGAAVIAHAMVRSKQRDEASIVTGNERVTVQLPTTAPRVSQESINAAIEMFKIRVPKDVIGPKLDLRLADRGQTLRKGAFANALVSVGPEAFSSWPMLASTLAHELEVHCQQNFVALHLMDITGLDGVGEAEREAYTYELRNAQRFGLSPYDQDLIRSTMDYFYPTTKTGVVAAVAPLRLWLDSFAAQTRSHVPM